jgi:hypothetical protein
LYIDKLIAYTEAELEMSSTPNDVQRFGPSSQSGHPPFPLILGSLLEIDRKLSLSEHYYVCVGSSPRTVAEPREIVYVVEGRGSLPATVWQQAIDAAVRVNPGARLRLIGARQRARWQSDGQPPRLRMVSDSRWDGLSKVGSEFITAEPLSLTAGPCCELIIAECGDYTRVIFRVLHAVMDGRGGLHFLHELFRFLRQEPLRGTNAGFGGAELMHYLGAMCGAPTKTKAETKTSFSRTVSLTGDPQGDETGETWKRISIHGAQRHIMARVAEAMAGFAQRDAALPMLFNIPVDLRRHVPELSATTAFTNNLAMRLHPGEGAADFKRNLEEMLAARREVASNTVFSAIYGILKFLPFTWLDRLLSPNRKNYRRPRRYNSSVISNLGRTSAGALACPGFQPDAFYFYSEQESTYCTMSSLDDRIELIIGMPCVYASDGRLETFIRYLEQRLSIGSGQSSAFATSAGR